MSDSTNKKTTLPQTSTPASAAGAGWIPEVVPDAHIAPEFQPGAEAAPSPPPEGDPAAPIRRVAQGGQVRERTTRAAGGTPAARPPRRHRERFTLVAVASAFRSMIFTFAAAVVVATIFMWWTPNDFLPARTRSQLASVQETARPVVATFTPVPTQETVRRIGIIAGHMGNERIPGIPDPGAVCEDGSGFYEAKVTIPVAERVVAILRGRGFEVDLLNEYDERLQKYQAAALVSLHADSCVYEFGSGFKNAYPALRETVREKDIFLSECIRANYEAMTRLEFLPNQITPNMTEYHAWNKIALTTPANILELGLLAQDRNLLQNEQDLLAQAIVNGILCFVAPTALATQQAASQIAPTSETPAAPVVTPTLALVTPGPAPTITLQPVPTQP